MHRTHDHNKQHAKYQINIKIQIFWQRHKEITQLQSSQRDRKHVEKLWKTVKLCVVGITW